MVDAAAESAAHHVVVHTDPVGGGWRGVHGFRPGDVLVPTAVPDVRLSVDEVLGEEPA